MMIGMPSARRIWERKTQDINSSTQVVSSISDRPAASSSGSVADTTSDARSTSQDDREGLGGDVSSSSIADTISDAQSALQDRREGASERENDSLSGLVSDRHAASTSSSVANVTSDAQSTSQDSQVDLSEGENDSLSDVSFYESHENL